MDTVPPVPGIPLDPVVDGDRIHTAGRQILGADNKAGVSVALELLRGLAAVPAAARPTVIAVFTIAEEKGLRGARALDVAALKADFAYVLDGEVPVGQVIATAPYKASLKIVVKGRRAHAALEPEKGVHAIAAAAAVIQAFPLGRYSATAVTNLGTIQGGTATNVIPDEVVVHGEMRCFQKDELEQLFETSRRTSIEAGRSVGAAVEVERHYLYAGYDVPVSAPPLRRLRIAAEQVAGIQFEKVSSIGGSDTNILCEKGVTAVDVGLGMHEIHSTAEWILASDLEKVTLWLMAALLADAVEDR
jgi:tripeptide aminopeptidase